MSYLNLSNLRIAIVSLLLLWYMRRQWLRLRPGELHAAREALGLSQERLAEKINVAAKTIHRWESGESKPRLKHLLTMRKMFLEQEKLEIDPIKQFVEKGMRGEKAMIFLGAKDKPFFPQ